MSANNQIDIYSRPQCHLCEEAKAVVERVQKRWPFSVRVINIEEDPELERVYGKEIPVVFVNGTKAFHHRVEEAALVKKVKELWKT